jgi:pilus assembly protein Flp/PilA
MALRETSTLHVGPVVQLTIQPVENLMTKLQTIARNFVRDEEGATAVEYALMVALIAAVIIVGTRFLGQTTSNTLGGVGNTVAAS